MAHNIATINGQNAIAFVGKTPWHGLGQRLHGATDLAEVLKAAALDWQVSVEPLYLADGRRAPQGRATVRSSDSAILGVVGPAYTPIQNADAIAVLQPAIEQFGVTVEVAGALGNGEVVWALAKLPQSVEVVPGDEVNGYALLRWSHDGTISLRGQATPIRVVCQNTLNIAVNGNTSQFISVRHTKSADDRLKEAAKLFTKLTETLIATGNTFSQLAEKRLNAGQVVKFIESVFPTPADGKVPDVLAERRKTVAGLVWNGIGADLAGSDGQGTTAWAAYNAVTEYFDHVRPREAKSTAGRENAQVSALFGGNHDLKARALDRARELVAA